MALKTPSVSDAPDVTAPVSTDVPVTSAEPAKLIDETQRTVPTRGVAQANGWGDFDKEYSLGAHSPEVKKNEMDSPEFKQKMAGEMIQGIVNSRPAIEKSLLSVGLTLPSLAEDLYNTGVDLTNGISSALGGEDLLERSNAISKFLPKGAGYEVTREISKFLVGYGAILKGVTKGGKATKSVQAAAGMATEFILAKQEQESLTEMLVKNVPGIGAPIYEFLNGEDDGPLEHRLKQSLLGVAEGEAAELLFKSIKHLKKVRNADKNLLDVPPELPEVPSVDAGDAAKVEAKVDEIPTLPEPELPPIPEEVFKAVDDKTFKEVKFRQQTGQGSVNAVDMVDKEGNKVYMNLTTMDIEDDVRRVTANMIESNPERYAKETFSTEDMVHLADNLDLTPEDIATWTRESGLRPGQILAAADMQMQAADAVVAGFRRFDAGDLSQESLAMMLGKADEMTYRLKDMKSAAGLMLKEADVPLKKGQTEQFNTLMELNRVYGGDVQAISKATQGWNFGAREMLKAINSRMVAPLADTLTQIRYAGMLSNPATHLRNLYGNTVMGVTRPGETLLAATVNAIERNPKGVHFGDAYHEMIGLGQGLMDALNVSAQKLRGREASFVGVDPAKAKLSQFVTESAAEPKSGIGQFTKFLHDGVIKGQFVGKALQFEDNFAKHINAMMTSRREAYRNGRKIMAAGGNKEEVAAIIQAELADPSKDTLAKMFKDAEYNTLTNDIEGTILKSLDTISATPIGKLIAPFAKVNLNAMTYKFERVPGLNFLLKKSRDELTHIDPAVRQKAIAKVGFSSSLMLGLTAYLHGTDSLIGSGPKDRSKFKMFEQAGRLQGSIRVGDQWVEYRKETPMGAILSMVADMADLRDAVDGQDDKYLEDAASVATSIVMEMFNPEYLTETTGELFTALNEGDSKKLRKVLLSVGESFLPYSGLARQINRQFTDEGRIKREISNPADIIESAWSSVMNVYAPSMLAQKKNILGHPMMHKSGLGPDLISPFGVNQETDNKVIQELAVLSGAANIVDPKRKAELDNLLSDSFINISMPSKVLSRNIGGTKQEVRLTLHEYEKLVDLTAGKGEDFGQSLEQTLGGLFKSAEYKNLSFKAKGIVAKKLIEGYRKAGIAIFLGQDSKTVGLEETFLEVGELLSE